jgi:Hypoxanthine-guanine phosphoribosyltransferase
MVDYILIVEDIIDTGRTLKYLQDMLIRRNAKSVRFVTLLDKPSGRVTDLNVIGNVLIFPMNLLWDTV